MEQFLNICLEFKVLMSNEHKHEKLRKLLLHFGLTHHYKAGCPPAERNIYLFVESSRQLHFNRKTPAVFGAFVLHETWD